MSSLATIFIPLALFIISMYFVIVYDGVLSIILMLLFLFICLFSAYIYVQSWREKINWRVSFLRKIIRPFKFYDDQLGEDVSYARHAISIDENRSDFRILLWEEDEDTKRDPAEDARRLRQVWFAGVHSDIGGSYPESESRLSDIALMKAVRGWFRGPRLNVEARGAVHDSVRERLNASEVLQFDEMKLYRPEGLKGHSKLKDIQW